MRNEILGRDIKIYDRREAGELVKDLAVEYGVHRNTIRNAVKRIEPNVEAARKRLAKAKAIADSLLERADSLGKCSGRRCGAIGGSGMVQSEHAQRACDM